MRVTELWHYNLEHKQILQTLNDVDYLNVIDRDLKELPLSHWLIYSNSGEEVFRQAQILVSEYIKKDLQSGQAACYDVVYTPTNIQFAEKTFVSRQDV